MCYLYLPNASIVKLVSNKKKPSMNIIQKNNYHYSTYFDNLACLFALVSCINIITLYQSSDFMHVDIGEYIGKTGNRSSILYAIPKGQIIPVIEYDNIELKLKLQFHVD